MTLNRWWQKVVSVRRHLMWATLWKWIVEVKVCDTGRKSFNCTQRWPSTSIKSSMRVTTSSEWVTRDSAVEGTGDWWSEHVNVVDNYRYVDRNPKRHSLHTHLHLCPTYYRLPLYKFKKNVICVIVIYTHIVSKNDGVVVVTVVRRHSQSLCPYTFVVTRRTVNFRLTKPQVCVVCVQWGV